MRIISGTARGTTLQSAESENTRQTLERVKENYFNAIAFDLPGKKVLDLFAGSGQLGLEALSRGAESAVFVDCDDNCVEVIRKNAQKTKLYQKCNVIKSDYTEYLSALKKRKVPEKFGVIFLDPPYDTDFLRDSVKKLAKNNFLRDGGFIVCECEDFPFTPPDEIADYFSKTKEYKYGKKYITLLYKKDSGEGGGE